MRNFLLAAVATAAIASPAMARDGSPYVGVELGVTAPKDTSINLDLAYPTTTTPGIPSGLTHYQDAADIDYKVGYDADLIGGYDLGMFRVEAELGYKHASINDIEFNEPVLFGVNAVLAPTTPFTNANVDFGGHATVLSGMINGMFDFGDDAGWGGFVGGGVGLARVRLLGDSDSGVAFQGIAGVRMAVSENMDVGLKYRYFRTSSMDWNSDLGFGADAIPARAHGRYESHSLLLSLIYNFYTPPPPPPPPPPAPERGL